MSHEPSDTPAVWRVATSPIGDLLRGRITGPHPREPKATRGWRGVVARSELPGALKEAVSAVVSRLRLWAGEREDVARELIAHFADAAASGKAERAAADEFGDPAQAAALITRAKQRARPAWWQVMRRGWQAAGLLLVLTILVYGYLAAQFWLRSPSIGRNYLAELNVPALAAPEADRAWPLYLQAIREEEPVPRTLDRGWGIYRPSDPEWPLVVAYLDRNQGVVRTLHAAAQRPTLGMVFHDQLPRDVQEVFSRKNPAAPTPPVIAPSENPFLFDVLLPHLGKMRAHARLLQMDAVAAAEQKDGERLLRDLETLAGMERHLKDGPFFISQLVALAIGRLACGAVDEVLRDSPDALSEEQWVRAAHVVAGIGDVRLRFDTERMFFDDLLQRVYSDEGGGDGRVTAEGMRVLKLISFQDPSGQGLDALDATLGPVQAAVIAGRKEMTREYDRLIARLRGSRERPAWEWGPRVSDAEMEAMDKRRFIPIAAVIPAIETVMEGVEMQRQHRDATLVAIAMELHRRRHGAWPATLAELAPDLLPAVPPDRIDGKPMRYVLRDGSPVLYSIGLDRDDDGGRVPAAGPMVNITWQPVSAMPTLLAGKPEQYDGDLVLFPPGPRAPITPSEPE